MAREVSVSVNPLQMVKGMHCLHVHGQACLHLCMGARGTLMPCSPST